MIGNILLNVRYLLAPILIIVAGAGVLLGGIMAWLGVVLLFVGLLVDIATKFETTGVGYDENGETLGWPTFQNLTMYFMLPVFVLFQLVMAWRLYTFMALGGAEGAVIMELIPGILVMHEGITGINLIGATLSSGIFIGIGIIYGHELSHTKGFGFVISRMMMALSGSAHFCYAHVYNHHLELASEDDPATAPRGRTIYGHYPLSYLGQSKFLFNMEKERLSRMGVSFISWQNRWIRGYLMAVPTVALFFAAGGWVGMACLATIWGISNFELEALNYLEHYGLIRVKDQPIDYRHNWDNSTAFIDDISNVSIEEFTNIIQKIADARAENGAEQQRVTTSYNLHSQNLVNLEAARGRIMDTDVALESTRFARHNVLVQASASMTAQANQLTNVALTLLQ